MKPFLKPLLALALCWIALASANEAMAEDASLRATLILGTNDGGGVDASLRQYERNLKRVLGFDTFKQQGSGTAKVSVPGTANAGIGSGHSVNFDVKDGGGGKLRLTVRWSKGSQTYVNTTVLTSKNQPTVLVGPASGEGKLILLVVAK